MAEQYNPFRGGNATPNDTQNRTPKEKAAPVDEYGGSYRSDDQGVKESDSYPVQNESSPARNLRNVGG